MDRKFNRVLNTVPQNGTEPFHITQLPSNILEAFIPGYSIIAGFLSDDFGVDISYPYGQYSY